MSILSRVRFVSTHAMERYRETQPGAVFKQLLTALEASVIVAAEIVVAMLARPSRSRTDPRSAERSTYLLCPDRVGLFVLSEDGAIVTYLRLGIAQRRFCEKEYPRAKV